MTDVTLPKFGVTMQEATIVEWFKGEGDAVAKGDALLSIQTDKVDGDIEAPVDGTLAECRHAAGEAVAVGEVLAVIEESGS